MGIRFRPDRLTDCLTAIQQSIQTDRSPLRLLLLLRVDRRRRRQHNGLRDCHCMPHPLSLFHLGAFPGAWYIPKKVSSLFLLLRTERGHVASGYNSTSNMHYLPSLLTLSREQYKAYFCMGPINRRGRGRAAKKGLRITQAAIHS